MSYKYSSYIESEYGLPGPLVFDCVHNGPDNYVFIVTDINNNKYALRQSKRLNKNVDFETELLVILSHAGLSLSQPLPTRSNNYSVIIDMIQLVLFVYIKGIQIEKLESNHLASDIIKRGAEKLGDLHYLTNGLSITAIPTRTIFTEYDRFLKLDMQILQKFKNHETVFDYARIFCKKAQTRIDNKKDLYGIIHNDYRIQNLIYTDKDCFIIDFDWACYGPLLKDIGLAIAEWSIYTNNGEPSKEAIDRFVSAYNKTAPLAISYDKNLIFWICFACLSDVCTFLVDVVEGQYPDKTITDIEQCYMYRKFKYFYSQLNNSYEI